ncbi:dTDP-4-amino-4,6-dideoxygalactose transaminase [Desulfohalotomaculum tongense]|uniref:DegT/DnrJ/EryC1/StrS family aminotransferase n=1 Tax=Desulforadius tongensis TaxID=1216062 RepID=UPI001958FBE1|nr:DegT/DnrJ/EryC1/StrS aminotransferase family protein [Desulforadius tongensis]MBM7854205.1 dTDP-4-amino-4,6-dideoxygalactose transaminase [Desulforadius tongensis]
MKIFSAEDQRALMKVLQSGKLHMGEQVRKFEQAFARYAGVKHAVAVSSGTAGMHIALRAAAVGPKEEVIVPPLAPVAGPNAVFYQGAVNIFADVDPATGNVDPNDIEPRINSNTRAIILHHYAGQPCHIQPVLDMVKGKDIAVIVDAAHALGARYEQKSVAGLGDMVVFDFGPGNHIYTGDGGMITTNSDETAQWLRIFRDEGFVKNKQLLTKDEGPWYYEMQDLGYPYRMTELQAALGLSQLSRVEQVLARREEIAGRYNEAFAGLEQVTIPHRQPGSKCAWGMYVLQLNSERLIPERRKIFVALKTRGVEVEVRHYPVFLHPYYIWAGHPDVCTLEGSRAPKAEVFYRRVLVLPIGEDLTDDAVEDIIEKVREVLSLNGRV